MLNDFERRKIKAKNFISIILSCFGVTEERFVCVCVWGGGGGGDPLA